jgi:hypothetical protein
MRTAHGASIVGVVGVVGLVGVVGGDGHRSGGWRAPS